MNLSSVKTYPHCFRNLVPDNFQNTRSFVHLKERWARVMSMSLLSDFSLVFGSVAPILLYNIISFNSIRFSYENYHKIITKSEICDKVTK